MRGRKPDTKAAQAGKGDTCKRGTKKLATLMNSHPEPTRGMPEAPEYLGPIARQLYEDWAYQLGGMDQDYRCDGPMLASAAVAKEQAILAYQVIQEKGQTVELYKDVEGDMFCVGIETRPEVGIWHKSETLFRSLSSEMGVTLVSRTRLTIEAKDEKSEEAFLKALSEPRAPRAERIQ